jgi:hypothetical protein
VSRKPRPILTDEEAEHLVRIPKQIAAKVVWKAGSGRSQRWRLRVSVFSEEINEPLEVCGTVGSTNWSFVLIYRKQNVRRLDATRGGHRNPDGVFLGRNVPHKHRWSEEHADRMAYIPEDIDLTDINTIFHSFLTESNIELIGEYQQLMLGAPPCEH